MKTTKDYSFFLLCFDNETKEARQVVVNSDELRTFIEEKGEFKVHEEVLEGLTI